MTKQEAHFVQDTTLPILIPEQAKFYCLIGKVDSVWNAHTFFHIGYIDESGHQKPLLEVGKVGDVQRYQDGLIGLVPKLLVGGLPSLIRSEAHLLRTHCYNQASFPINYSAYEINKQQYLYFLGVLKSIYYAQIAERQKEADQLIATWIEKGILRSEAEIESKRRQQQAHYVNTVPNIYAYQPTGQGNEYRYLSIQEWQERPYPKVNIASTERDRIVNGALKLSISNTCRNTGIDFLNICLDGEKAAYQSEVSPLYINNMPCRTTMQAGRYQQILYLLPLPPTSYELEKDQQAMLYTIYKRMEGLLKNYYQHPGTRRKFDLLKALYDQLVEKEQPKLDFLLAIQQFSNQHQHQCDIDEHRGLRWPFFEHQTRTRAMFNQFCKALESEFPQGSHEFGS